MCKHLRHSRCTLADDDAVPIPPTERNQDTMVVVTPKRDYHITKVKFTIPVEETYQAASAELVIAKM